MATLMDIHGDLYDVGLTGIANKFGEQITSPIDVGTHLYVPQPDGTWHVTHVIETQQNETRALDAKAKGPMGV